MGAFHRILARINRHLYPQAPATHFEQCGSCRVCQEHERQERLHQLRQHRIAGVFRRGMDALNHRAPGMSDADRLILARSIVTMMDKNLV